MKLSRDAPIVVYDYDDPAPEERGPPGARLPPIALRDRAYREKQGARGAHSSVRRGLASQATSRGSIAGPLRPWGRRGCSFVRQSHASRWHRAGSAPDRVRGEYSLRDCRQIAIRVNAENALLFHLLRAPRGTSARQSIGSISPRQQIEFGGSGRESNPPKPCRHGFHRI